jgi:hypothetical protein
MNSPYSRFGLGDLEPGGFAINKSMGGTGIALREQNQINYLNPASFTSQDSMSFIWDFGMKGNNTVYKNSSNSMERTNFNFDHLSLAFPVTKFYFASAGMIPYSTTGYDYFEKTYFSDGEAYKSRYTGSGNINRFYVGNAIKLLKNKLNVGLNVSYLFGSMYNSTLFNMVDTSNISYGVYTNQVYDIGLSGWLFTLGAQGTFKINNDLNLIIGGILEPRALLDVNASNSLKSSLDTISNTPDSGTYKIPARIGGGLCVQYKNNLILSLDYTMQDWSKADFLGKTNNLSNSNRLSLGIQFVPDKESFRSYFAKVRYRAGLHYENTYITLKNTDLKDYGFSLGLGLPFKRTNTMFNLGFEMGKRGTTANNLIEDNYMKFSVSVTLYDFWFYKRKYD